MAKLFGESISKDVVKQLEQRESILATGARDSQHLRYLNEKTAWVRAISGINQIAPDTSEYSSNMAKEFILSGGRLKWNAETKKFEPRATNINFGQQEDGRYSYTETLGIRPEPGITSFSITHKNRFGTIREANLSFVVWTRADLLKAERLFLRPGAQVIVEWGNSTYVDNEGTVENIPTSDQYNEFFNTVYVEKIYEIINKTKKDSSYNYDGFLGLVTNFTWNYRMDGGYDCSISIVSRSAVLESLTLLKPLDEGKTDSYFNSSQKTSLLHYFISVCNKMKIEDIATEKQGVIPGKKNFVDLTDLENIEILEKTVGSSPSPRGYTSTYTVTTSQTLQTNIKSLLSTSNKDYIYKDGQENFFDSLKVYGFDGVVDPGNDDREVKFRYISLRYLLAVINKAFVFPRTKDTDFPSFYLGQEIKEELIPHNTPGGVQTYKTFDQHVSLDPFIGILPKEPQFSQDEKDEIFFVETKYESWATKYIPTSVKQINPFQIIINNISKSIQTGSSDILDIHVNLNAVKQILDSYFSSDTEPVKINVLDLVKKILDLLNNAFGNINSFDIDFNEDLQKYFLVDREIVNEQLAKAIENKSVELLNVTGLRNTVSDISIESKITSELSSMIAISNQAPIVDEVNANQPLIDWNAGTKNRFVNKDQKGVVENEFAEVLGQNILNTASTTPFGTAASEPTNYVDPNAPAKTPEQIEKDKKLEESQKKETEKRLTFFKELGEAYLKLNNFDSNFLSRRKYKSEFFDKVKGEGSLVFKKRLTTDNIANKRVDQGLIPLQLSVTLDGISGFRIGQVFKIGSKSKASNILPDVYDNYGFIITGIDSSIGTEGKWLTTLRAQTFRLD